MLKSSLLRLRHCALAVAAPVVLLLILISLPQVASADPTAGPSTTPTVGATLPPQVDPTAPPAGTPSVGPNPSLTGPTTADSNLSTAGTPTAEPTPVSTKRPLAARAAGDEPVRPLASTAISGVLRNAETGGPIRSSCVAYRTAGGSATNVTNVQDDGTWSIEVDTEAGPFQLAFYVVDHFNCSGPVRSDDYLPAWYENQPFTGTDPFTAIPPTAASSVEPGTEGVVACLARDALATACATPTTKLSGTVITAGARPIEQACVAVINPEGGVVGPGITDADGRWAVEGLANDTPFVVGVIPPFPTAGRPCEFNGPPPSPGPGELQPEFYRNVWADFNQNPDNPLFADPYGWAIQRGAATVTNSTSGITVCLTIDPGTVVPRPSCDTTQTPGASAGLGPEATQTSIPVPNAGSGPEATAPATGPRLADTGGPRMWLVALACLLVAAGAVLIRSRMRPGAPIPRRTGDDGGR